MLPAHGGLDDKKIESLQNYLDTLPNAMHFEHIDGFFLRPDLQPKRRIAGRVPALHFRWSNAQLPDAKGSGRRHGRAN